MTTARATHQPAREERQHRAAHEPRIQEEHDEGAGALPQLGRHDAGRVHEHAGGEPAVGDREDEHDEDRPVTSGNGAEGVDTQVGWQFGGEASRGPM